MGINGLLTDVRWEWTGTEVTEDLLAGTTVLPVLDPEAASPQELVWIVGTGPYEIVDQDVDASTFTISPGLEIDVDAEGEVALDVGDQPGRMWVAEVILADADKPVEVLLTIHDLSVIPEGTYDPPIVIVLSDDLERVENLPGSLPVIDGTYIPAETIPVPTPAPPVAPVFNVTGLPRGLIVQVTNGQPGWIYTYTITNHTNDVLPDVTDSYPDTQRPLLYVENMPDGMPLDPESDGYSFQVRATNSVGEYADSAQSSPQPLVLNDDNTIAELNIGKVTAGDLVGVFALLGALQVGDGIRITPESGIEIDTPLGTMILPTDGSSPIFKGEAIFDAATISGNFKLQGRADTGNSNEIAKGGVLNLAAAVSAPKSSPSVVPVWPRHEIHPGFTPYGLAYHAGADRWLQVESVFGIGITKMYVDGNGDYIWNDTTHTTGPSPNTQRPEMQFASSLCIKGNTIYTLVRTNESFDGTFTSRWFIYEWLWDTVANSTTYVRRTEYNPDGDFLGGWSKYDGAIGYDSVLDELQIVQPAAVTGEVWILRYQTNGTYIARGRLFESDGTTRFVMTRSISGLVVDSSGDRSFHIATRSRSGVYSFGAGSGSTVTFRTGRDELYFEAPFSGFSALAYHDGQWLGRNMWAGGPTNDFYSQVYEFSDIMDRNLYVYQTWRKADATGPDYSEFETAPSPTPFITATFPRRAFARIETGGPIPYDGTDPDTPDAASFYVAVTALGTLSRQELPPPYPDDMSREITLSEIDVLGGAPPGPLDRPFPDSTPAVIESDGENSAGNPTIWLTGSGAGRAGPYEWDNDGVSTLQTIRLIPTMSGVSGHDFFIREIAPGTVAVSGYVDVDDTNTSRRDTGMRIPAGWRPISNLIVAAPHMSASGGAFRYFFGTDGVIEFEQTGGNAPFESISAIWFTQAPL